MGSIPLPHFASSRCLQTSSSSSHRRFSPSPASSPYSVADSLSDAFSKSRFLLKPKIKKKNHTAQIHWISSVISKMVANCSKSSPTSYSLPQIFDPEDMDMVFFPININVGMLSMRACVTSDEGANLPNNVSEVLELTISQMSRLGQALAAWRLLRLCLATFGNLSDHQRSVSFSFTETFVLANTLMLVLPLDALAETCESDNSLFNMPLLFGIALIGATVGGLLARQRRGELKRLNDQLRQINAALRRQAKIESYAPNLSYAPVSRVPEAEVIVDPRKQQIITHLRSGKNFLRNQDPEKAFGEFKAAFELAQALGDHVEEKKAARGLGASLQRQGNYKDAIKYHSRVLDISKQTGEDSGATEAYGAIADCYTELGDLERAGKFYDKYIARLESD